MSRPLLEGKSAGSESQAVQRKHALPIALAFLLILILLLILRYGPLKGYTADAGSFSGGFAYRYNQLQSGGHDLNENIPVYSSFDSGVNPVRGEVFFVKLQFMMAQVLGVNRYSGDLLAATLTESLMLTTAFLAMGWLWSGRLGLPTHRGWLRWFVTVVFVAGSPTIILYLLGWNAAYGWYFILAVIYLWQRPRSITKNRTLVILFSMVLFGIYTTAALALLTLTIFATLFMRRSFLGISLALVVYTVAFFGYLSRLMFGTIIHLPEALLSVLQFEAQSGGLVYLAPGDPLIRALNGIAAVAIAVPLAASVFPIRKATLPGIETRLAYAAIASLLVYAVGAASSIGIASGLLRTTEYASIFSLCLIPYSLRKSRTSVRRLIGAALLSAVLLSAAIQVTSPTVPAQYVSWEESLSTNWIVAHTGDSTVIFTDFRLAGPLVAAGHLRVVGVSDLDLSPVELNERLIEIYYVGNPCAAEKGLASIRTFTNEGYNLVMVSGRMTLQSPGIKGYNRNFAPAPVGFDLTFGKIPALSKVYDNGQVHVFARTGSMSVC